LCFKALPSYLLSSADCSLVLSALQNLLLVLVLLLVLALVLLQLAAWSCLRGLNSIE